MIADTKSPLAELAEVLGSRQEVLVTGGTGFVVAALLQLWPQLGIR